MTLNEFKIVRNDGLELNLSTLDFSKKVAIISYDSESIDVSKCGELREVINRLQNIHNAAGVFLLDKHFDLLAMAEEDLGVDPKFAYKFLNNICIKSQHKNIKQQKNKNEKIKDIVTFHNQYAIERVKVNKKVTYSVFVLGALFSSFCALAYFVSLWNLIGAALFFVAFCNTVYRVDGGEYEQEASENAGNKIKGRSYNPHDYV